MPKMRNGFVVCIEISVPGRWIVGGRIARLVVGLAVHCVLLVRGVGIVIRRGVVMLMLMRRVGGRKRGVSVRVATSYEDLTRVCHAKRVYPSLEVRSIDYLASELSVSGTKIRNDGVTRCLIFES